MYMIFTHTQAAEATMETHTLARYISESTLQEYQFVDVKPSLIAASAMYLALRMKKLGPWVSELWCARFCTVIGLRELRLFLCAVTLTVFHPSSCNLQYGKT